jgi:uncharacterized coiled-coil protein SlyX
MSSFVTEEQVRRIFGNLNIGCVSRVDFIPVCKKPGFAEEPVSHRKSMIVHFKYLNYSFMSPAILEEIEAGGYSIFPRNLCLDWPSEKCGEYWLLLKAVNPIQETTMNNSQIVHNCRLLEKKVYEQSDNILLLNHKLAEKADKIQQLETKLENVQEVVYQLLGGLFCGTTQAGILSHHIGHLFGDKNSNDKKTNSSKWGNNPTTSQGDSNENRIDALEAQMAAAGELLYNMTKKEIEVYEPTRSPFCNFKYYAEDDDDEDQDTSASCSSATHDSMPELESIYTSDSSVEKRRINSFELCGNE